MVHVKPSELAMDDPLLTLLQSYADEYGIAELMLLPLTAGDRIIGVLGLLRDGGAPAYEQPTVDTATALASTAALGLETTSALSNALEGAAIREAEAATAEAAVERTPGP